MSNSQINKLKSGIKNCTEVTNASEIRSNVVGYSNDKTNLPHKLLLTNTQISRVCKASAVGSSANTKQSIT